MSNADSISELRMDEVDDLWWVFYLREEVRPFLGHNLVEMLSQRGAQVVDEHLNGSFFQILLSDVSTGVYFEISNSSDRLTPHLFLSVKADLVVPPETPSARLHADLFLEYGKVCYEVLSPKYAFAENLNMFVEMADVDAPRLTHVCWANLFGHQFVEGVGRGIILSAPAWRNENLRDGGILYVLAASPYLYQGPRQYWQAAREYFQQHIPERITWSDTS